MNDMQGHVGSLSDACPNKDNLNFWAKNDKCRQLPLTYAHFKRRATVMPNSIDRIKFDFSTAVARRLKPSCATAV